MKKKILVIDDDSSAREMIVGVLGAQGYEARGLSEFESLPQELQRFLPDLVVTDVVMPTISGFEVCRKIKEMLQPHPPLVIVMTGKLPDVDALFARKIGADGFAVKTPDMAVLIQVVRKILSL